MDASRQAISRALRRVSALCHLSPARLDELASVVERREYMRAEAIEVSDGVLVVVHGGVEATIISMDGKELRLARYGKYDLCLARQEVNWAAVVVTRSICDGTVVGILPRDSLVRAMQNSEETIRAILTWQETELRRAERLAAMTSLLDVRARLACHLAEVAASDPERTVRATHAEIATDIGTTRQRITQHLNHFRSLHIIQYDHRHPRNRKIIVVDLPALERIGRGTPYCPPGD